MLVEIKMLDWVAKVFMPVVLFYRRMRYGYSFRRIRLTHGKYAIVDPDDFKKLSGYKWIYSTYPCTIETVGYYHRIAYMHRKIIEAPKKMVIDHKNRNPLDNRKANLRIATPTQNACNQMRRPHSSRFKGVSWKKSHKKWCVNMRIYNKRYFIGNFTDEIEAAKAYDKAAKKYQGEFAYLNFPPVQKSHLQIQIEQLQNLPRLILHKIKSLQDV